VFSNKCLARHEADCPAFFTARVNHPTPPVSSKVSVCDSAAMVNLTWCSVKGNKSYQNVIDGIELESDVAADLGDLSKTYLTAGGVRSCSEIYLQYYIYAQSRSILPQAPSLCWALFADRGITSRHRPLSAVTSLAFLPRLATPSSGIHSPNLSANCAPIGPHQAPIALPGHSSGSQ